MNKLPGAWKWLIVVGSLLSGWQPALAQQAPSAEGVAAQLANTTRLIETSSAAQRIENSANQVALQRREQAREHLRQARTAFDAGDIGRADSLIHQAKTVMFQAVQLAGSGGFKARKAKSDFDNRERSVEELVKALMRVGDEKGEHDKTQQIVNNVEKLKARADQLVAEHKYSEGRKVLDGAYELTKKSIEALRGGDTLVRSLNFATKEEEYHYEQDRNDTHQMLVKVLLEEKMNESERVASMVNSFLDKARALREQGDRQAAAGDFESAVTTLEAATKELVRAIRSAGIYIPG